MTSRAITFAALLLLIAAQAESTCMLVPWTRVFAHEVEVLQCGMPHRLLLSRYSRVKERMPGLSFDLRNFIEGQDYVALLVHPGRTFVAQFEGQNRSYPPPGCWLPNTLDKTEFLIPSPAGQDCSDIALGRRLFRVGYHCDDTPNFESMLRSGLVLYPFEFPVGFDQAPECPVGFEFWPPRD